MSCMERTGSYHVQAKQVDSASMYPKDEESLQKEHPGLTHHILHTHVQVEGRHYNNGGD